MKKEIKKYRKIKKSDNLPELPKSWKPMFILKENDCDYIFAIGKKENYTVEWDRVSRYPDKIWEKTKDKNDLYRKQRLLLTKFLKDS
jgi:hypothetical protein